MHSLIDLIVKQMGNQFVGGGLVLMLTGSLIALARRIPGQVWFWLKSRFTRTVSIENSDPLFDYVTYWLDSQERFRKSRFLRATTELRLQQKSDSSGPSMPECATGSSSGYGVRKKQALKVFFSPSIGRHFFSYHGVWVSIAKGSPGQAASPGGAQHENPGNQMFRKQESYTIESLGKSDGQVLKDLVQEIVDFGTEETEGVRVYFSSWGHWTSNGYTRMRPLRTVVLPAGVAEEVLADMRKFRSEELWYRDLGIPWHKGYLFFGMPGAGKTSLAAALAGELEMDLYLLNLSGTGMNDENLQRLMSDVRPGCMVILEDIDCTIPDRDAPLNNNRVTLSGLLNCLDGIMSREGCVIVMTTNRREGLDSALVRPGRVDYELEFGYADHQQIVRLAAAIGVESHGLCGGELTMAEVQKVLLDRYRAGDVAEKAAVA